MQPQNSSPAVDSGAHAPREDTIRSLFKAIAVLDCFSRRERQLSVAEIAKRIGVPRPTAHRIVMTLQQLGLLERQKDREQFRLGMKLFEYGTTVLNNLELQGIASPFVETLTKATGLTVHLSVFDGERATIIKRVAPNRERSNSTVTIEAAPCHVTSTGKAILAFQPSEVIERIIQDGLPAFTHKSITDPGQFRDELAGVRRLGYSLDDEEQTIAIRCVGAPIRNAAGIVFASLSVSGATRKFPESQIQPLAKLVIQYANAVSTQLGFADGVLADEL